MFYTVVQRGFQEMASSKPIIYFVDSLSLIPIVKEFSKSVNIWWSHCKNSTPRFFKHSVHLQPTLSLSCECNVFICYNADVQHARLQG